MTSRVIITPAPSAFISQMNRVASWVWMIGDRPGNHSANDKRISVSGPSSTSAAER